jgi:hypothetical protein
MKSIKIKCIYKITMKIYFSVFLISITFFSCNKEIIQHTVSVSVSPINSGSVSPSSNTYEVGQSLQMFATPSSEYQFKEWEGDL